MASPFTGRPAVSGDDGDTRSGVFDNTRVYVGIGYLINDNADTFFRVPTVNIQNGAKILTAKLTFKANTNKAGNTMRVNIYMNDSDDAVAPISEAQHNGKARTTAFTVWDGEGAWVQDTLYDSPDFAGPVQEVVDRGAWVLGNAMMILIDDDGSDIGAYRTPDAQDLAEGTAALFTVEFAGGFIPKSTMM